MKRFAFALAGALLAAGAAPALAASSIDVPTATSPSTDPHADDTTFAPAAVAQISWDGAASKPAVEDATARVATDGKYLYVRFDATQQERIVSSQPSANGNGDLVWVELTPAGSGSTYRFMSAPDGSSAATSSQGAAPAFNASGATYDGGYTVTMKIPLSALGAHGATWNAQFGRTISAKSENLVWSHEGNVAQAGTMTIPASVGAAQ